MDPSSVPTSTSSPWPVVAAVFIALFALTLVAGGLTTRHFLGDRKKRLLRPANPHAFGTDAWRLWEDARLPRADRDALRIAGLEAQVGMLEEAGGYLDRAVELAEMRNRDLGRQLSGPGPGPGPDPGVFAADHTCGAVRGPGSETAGAIPVPEYSVAQPPAPPPGLPALLTTKLRGLVKKSVGASPEREVCVENPGCQVMRPRAASLAVASPLSDVFVIGDEDDVSVASNDEVNGPEVLIWSNV